jgi:hypothetical protein
LPLFLGSAAWTSKRNGTLIGWFIVPVLNIATVASVGGLVASVTNFNLVVMAFLSRGFAETGTRYKTATGAWVDFTSAAVECGEIAGDRITRPTMTAIAEHTKIFFILLPPLFARIVVTPLFK